MNYTCENCIFFESHSDSPADVVGICNLTGDIITVDFDCQHKIAKDSALVDQLEEQVPSKHKITGSSPVWGTLYKMEMVIKL